MEARLHNHITPKEEKYQVYMNHLEGTRHKKVYISVTEEVNMWNYFGLQYQLVSQHGIIYLRFLSRRYPEGTLRSSLLGGGDRQGQKQKNKNTDT